jgi:hypothetical protein
MKMKEVINIITGAFLGISLAITMAFVASLIFSIPVWVIWNFVVVDVFNTPHLSFFDTLWVMVMIRLIIPSETKTKESK